jgi:hypothetical protein
VVKKKSFLSSVPASAISIQLKGRYCKGANTFFLCVNAIPLSPLSNNNLHPHTNSPLPNPPSALPNPTLDSGLNCITDVVLEEYHPSLNTFFDNPDNDTPVTTNSTTPPLEGLSQKRYDC